MKRSLRSNDHPFCVADFAAGEYDRIPSFILKLLPDRLPAERSIVVYSIDMHPLRLDSQFAALEAEGLHSFVRPVEARLETMLSVAKLRPQFVSLLKGNIQANWIDETLLSEERIPGQSFDLGIFNNDIIGYMLDYYQKSSDLEAILHQVFSSMKSSSMLVVTGPSEVKKIDNIALLEKSGFRYLQAIDIELSTGHVSISKEPPEPAELSRIGHYSALFFGS